MNESTPRKKFQISGWLLIFLLAVAVAVPSLLYWSIERNDMHVRWQVQLHLAQTFAFYGMDQAEVVLLNPNFTSDTAFRDTGRAAVQTGSIALNTLYKLDWDRANQLDRIETTLNYLAGSWSTYTSSMNQSQRMTLGGLLHTIGRDILFAYGNYINYTSADDIRGPSFWYTGPSPPNTNLIQQAVDLAVNFPGLPTLLIY
jgi:hypothetical protein